MTADNLVACDPHGVGERDASLIRLRQNAQATSIALAGMSPKRSRALLVRFITAQSGLSNYRF